MSKLTQKIARIAFGDIFGRGIGFATTIYLARTLGSEAFGMLTIGLSFLGYAIWVSDLGLLNIGAREVAKEPLKRIFRAKEVFLLKIVLGILVFGFSFLIIPTFEIPEEQKEIIQGFMYSLIPYALLMEWYYNGKQYFGKVAFSKIAHSSLYLILVLLFVHSREDLSLVPVVYAIGISFSAFVLGAYSFKENPFELPARGWAVIKDLFQSALTLGSGDFFKRMLQLLPPLLIGFLLSANDAGIYGAAIRIIFIAMLIDRIFVHLLLPNLASQWIENISLAKSNVRIASRLLLLIGSVLALGIAISSPVLIEWIYGNEYVLSSPVLSILTVFLFFTFLNSLFSTGLLAIGKDQEYFNSSLFAGIISATIMILASTTGDLYLVAVSVAISEVIFTGFALFWFRKHVSLKIIGKTTITILIAAGLYSLSLNFDLYPILEAFVFSIILIPLLLIFRVINSNDLFWLIEKLKS